ncbi:MAG TPA: hypothetical protein VN325_20630 [Steroidobacteraceae bacterium]|nr:hypothetical protein [Steroidobacteraceae bacterium]
MKNGMATPDLNGSAREAARSRARLSTLICAGTLLLLTANLGVAQTLNKDQAKRMYDRIAGVTASDATLTSMVGMDATQAALNIVTKDPAFYNNTIRNLAMPWTNRDQTVFAPLNDYVATVVGMVRDNVPFNTLLSADLVYIADASAASTYSLPAYSPGNNDLYQQMDDNGVDLKAHLVSSTQSALTGVPATATAGVLTTRAAAAAFFINGTNRAMFRFTMMNHLCSDLQTIMDTTRPPDRIRQDVTRSPGGDSGLFLNNCIGCHSGMDPMAQAFAYYNFNNTDPTTTATVGQIVYTAGQVQPKYFINNTNFPQGYVTPDDRWDNRWRGGVNSLLGWDPNQTGSGQGAKSLGQELAGSQAFASCQVTRVFKYVCFRAPSNAADRTQVATMVASFKSSNYSLRQVFADAAVYCMGN